MIAIIKHLTLLVAVVPLLAMNPWAIGTADQEVEVPQLKLLGKVEEHTDAADFVRPYVYLSDRGKFRIIDIANPAKPSILGTIDLKTTATTLKCTGDIALIATASGSLQAVAIGNPRQPILLSTIPLPGKPYFLEVRPKLAFVGFIKDKKFGFVTVDFTYPRHQSILGIFEVPHPPDTEDTIIEHSIINVSPSGKTLIMNTWDYYWRYYDTKGVLLIVNTTNPAHPVLATKAQAPTLIANIITSDQAVQADYYHWSMRTVPEISGSLFFDLSDPTHPRPVNETPVHPNGRGKGGHRYAADTFACGNTLFINSLWGSSGLFQYDLSNPQHYRIIKKYPTRDDNGEVTHFWVSGHLILVRERPAEYRAPDWLNILEY